MDIRIYTAHMAKAFRFDSLVVPALCLAAIVLGVLTTHPMHNSDLTQFMANASVQGMAIPGISNGR